jgi:hypothetical protein
MTTLFYFAAATLHCNWFFYSVEAVTAAGLIYYAIKHRLAFESLLKHFRRFDWVLAVLIAASMVASIPAQSVWRRDPQTGGMIYDGFSDRLYHVGLAYELSRHIPPRQATIRGGTPEPAYHHFMHLTTMLIGRYSGQPDMLRAHLIYHYAVIQILMCLLLSIGRTLAGSRVAGYCNTSLDVCRRSAAPNLWPVASLVVGVKGLPSNAPRSVFLFHGFPPPEQRFRHRDPGIATNVYGDSRFVHWFTGFC